MSNPLFAYDVFLSHSAKDKAIVRPLAERLRGDGLRVWFDEWEIRAGDNIPLKIEEGLERSRILVLCMSADAFGSDWAQLESQTFRFRDPLNRERRLVPLRLDDAPVQGSLAQFRYVDWRSDPSAGYPVLLEACGAPAPPSSARKKAPRRSFDEMSVQLERDPGGRQTIRGIAFSPDRKWVAGAVNDTIYIWEIATGKRLRSFRRSEYDGLPAPPFRLRLDTHVNGTGWSPDQGRLVSGGYSLHGVRVWDVETGECLRVFKGHEVGALMVVWSPDGRYVLHSHHDDKALRVWEVKTGRCLHILQGHHDWARDIAMSPENGLVLSCGDDKTLRLWDVETERCLRVFLGHEGSVKSVAVSGDWRHAVSASSDMTVRWWDVETGQCRMELTGHTKAVWSVALHSDGRHVLSGSVDETARLWDLATGECRRVLRGHAGTITSVAWGEHGRAFSCDVNGCLNSWDLSGFLADA